MKIKIAKSSGYCMGVRRAVEMALDAAHKRPKPIYSYGPLIHNPQALDLLASKGLKVLNEGEEQVEGLERGTIIIRAHGITPRERNGLKASGQQIIDATCPRVIRVQTIIRKHALQGYGVLIWGSPEHPEVIGLLGHAEGRGFVFTNPEDLADAPDFERVILVAQTTQKKSRFDDIVTAVADRWPEALVFDTICGATERRQEDVRQLAKEVEAMVVVGGHASGNTQRLAAVAAESGVKTIHVETDEELDPEWFQGVTTVGVTAGASTPNWMIKRVIRKIERIDRVHPSARTWTYRILRMMILSNVYAALGAGSLCLAGAMMQNIPPRFGFFGVAFFYIHAMHMLNLFLDKEASKFNDPDRVLFLEKHKRVLYGSGLFSAVVGLSLSLSLNVQVFGLLIGMSALGLLYAVPFLPRGVAGQVRIRRLKDIPSSKTLSTSAGWALILSLAPALSPEGRIGWGTLYVALFIFFLVFVRSAMGDILDIQGDRVVGRETIPILIGERKTLQILYIVTAAAVYVLAMGWVRGNLTSLALVLMTCGAYGVMYQLIFRSRQIMSTIFFEAFVDANFLLAGVLTWVWWMVRH